VPIHYLQTERLFARIISLPPPPERRARLSAGTKLLLEPEVDPPPAGSV